MNFFNKVNTFSGKMLSLRIRVINNCYLADADEARSSGNDKYRKIERDRIQLLTFFQSPDTYRYVYEKDDIREQYP